MPETILFRGVILRDMDLRQAAKGASTFVRMHCVADFTDTVRDAMGWKDLPKSYSGGKPDNSTLTGVEMTMRPNGNELKKYGFSIPISQAKDFEVVTVKEKDEEVRQLKFTIETTAKKAYRTVGDYIEAIGQGRGQLKLSYATEAENADGTKQESLLTSEEMRAAAKPEAD
jgi:hypothetical protein